MRHVSGVRILMALCLHLLSSRRKEARGRQPDQKEKATHRPSQNRQTRPRQPQQNNPDHRGRRRRPRWSGQPTVHGLVPKLFGFRTPRQPITITNESVAFVKEGSSWVSDQYSFQSVKNQLWAFCCEYSIRKR